LLTFGEYPAKLENIKDFQSSLGVFGDMYMVTTTTFVHLQDTLLHSCLHTKLS
jgi:hypothetical protein